MEQPWRTVYAPDGVERALSGLLWGLLVPLALFSPSLFPGMTGGSTRNQLAVAAAGFVIWRTARTVGVGVATFPGGIIVMNVYRSFRIPWDQVDGVLGRGEDVDPFGDDGSLLYPRHLVVQDEFGDWLLLGRIEILVSGKPTVSVGCLTTETLATILNGYRAANQTNSPTVD